MEFGLLLLLLLLLLLPAVVFIPFLWPSLQHTAKPADIETS
jgi:hypothetical protein